MTDFNKYRTLFLDRDGVINKRIPGSYIKKVAEFEFYPGAVKAIAQFTQQFDCIVVVTNQAGIGKGIMTEEELEKVHRHMLDLIEGAGGQIDGVYHCPELADNNPECRKPNPGMALKAQKDFPDIVFEESIIVGDSYSDMAFGKRLGMATVLIEGKAEEAEKLKTIDIDYRLKSLAEFAALLIK